MFFMGTVFSAYDIRGRLGENFSKEYVWTLGKAFVEWLPEEGQSIIVATSSQADETVVHAFIEGALLQGRDVIYLGEGGEQTVNGGITDHKAAGGALISHDGTQNIEVIALYDAQGVPVTAENGLTELAELADSANFLPADNKGKLVNK